jgi:arylsulfatase A
MNPSSWPVMATSIAFGMASCAPQKTTVPVKSPNIILILADDLGWSCTSLGMDDADPESRSDYYETPRIDRMAKEGIRFTNGYAPAAICSPTRRSILLGQTPARLGDETFPELVNAAGKDKLLTLPRVLKAANPDYRTAHYGKWDLRADIFPEDMGYDESDGDTGNSNGNLMTGNDDRWSDQFITNDPKRMVTLTRRAVNFMERQVKGNHPFYLQVSHYATHVDIQTKESTLEKYNNKPPGTKHQTPGWAGMLEDLDTAVGEILDAVDKLGIAGNTYVIFMSDNGAVELIPPVPSSEKLNHPDSFSGPMRNFPLRGGKWTLYEGGIRVPFIIKGPGIQQGSTCRETITGWDLLPTFAELTGHAGTLPASLDGGSFKKLLSDPAGKVTRANDFLVFHRYHDGYPHSAIIRGDFKLIRFWKSGQNELYNLRSDKGERNDIASAEPGQTKELEQLLNDYLLEVNPVLHATLLSYNQPGENK